MEGPSQNTINLIKTNASLISYAIVCAAARRPPRRAYFLFEPHPDPNNGYTFNLSSIIKKNTESRVNPAPLILLRMAVSLTIRNRANMGLIKYTALFIGPKTVNLLVNSFTASATGCSRPHRPTLLGPIRAWDKESAFRSIKVMNATLTKTTRTPIKNSSIIKIQLILQ